MIDRPYTFDEIIDASVKLMQSTKADIMSDQRSTRIVNARRITTAALRELSRPNASFPEIAAALGRKYHSTYQGTYQRWLKLHPSIRQNYLDIIISEIEHKRKKRAKLHAD